jgi:hypothetical protein
MDRKNYYRVRVFFVLAIFGLCFCRKAAWAVAGGSLSGTIKDPSSASVPNAQLVLTNVDQRTVFKATSDRNGFYSFPAVPVGHYDLRIESPGFVTQEKKNLIVDADAALRIDVVLSVGQRQEVVTVTAAQEGINTQPDTESANGFMVDAIDVREHMNGGTSVIPNLDSIQEFRVLTNNFDPEYGNYNGGLVNVITKSGTNSFHGDTFEFVRNTDLDARNFFDSTRGAFRQNQFGGTIGGPIKHDTVFFFVDYQGTRTVEGITSAETQVPSMQDRSGNLSDLASTLTGTVSGPYTASLLT